MNIPIQKLLSVFFLLVMMLVPSIYAEGDQEPQLWKRKILGIYDSQSGAHLFSLSRLQVLAHAPLNHLGYYIKLLDIRNDPLPSPEELEDYAAIFNWLETPSIPNPDDYLLWLELNKTHKKKFIFMGYTGMEEDEAMKGYLPVGMKARFLRLVDLQYREEPRPRSAKIRIRKSDSKMVEFERKLSATAPGDFEWYRPREGKNVKTWLSISHDDIPNSESSIVTTSPSGGFVKEGYEVWQENYPEARSRWIINPFLFFNEILQTRHIPVPDPTTLRGKRIFYSHIDGDAFNNFSLVKQGKFSGEVVEEVLKEFSQIPVGVSFIVAEVNPDFKGSKKLVQVAKRILSLDNVEIASHAYTHPYHWRGEKRTSAYRKTPFDLEQEIRGSIDYINKNLAPKGKKLKTFYWTGDTTPPEEALEILDQMGIQNLNGGDAAFDQLYNSYTSVAPYIRDMGKYWQIHSSNSNENLYTSLWKENFNGFENVIQTFERTEKPIRVAAANSYYHFYSGDRKSSLGAIRKVYQYAIDQGYEAIFPSEYVDIVKGFLTTQVRVIEPGTYQIENRGKLNTLRLDQGKVDLAASKGVLQVDKINQSFYISLDPKVKKPVIKVIE